MNIIPEPQIATPADCDQLQLFATCPTNITNCFAHMFDFTNSNA